MQTEILRLMDIAAISLGAGLPVLAQPASLEIETPPPASSFRAAGLALEALVNEAYAYTNRLPGGRFSLTAPLRAEAEAVTDRRSLQRFLERALFLLPDHHAITALSNAESWAIVPSYTDIWVEFDGTSYPITAVRAGSPAAQAGVAAGDQLKSIGGLATGAAVDAFWSDLDVQPTADQRAFAARVLAAGRRDRQRSLTVLTRGAARDLTIADLYTAKMAREGITTRREGTSIVIAFGDSLGDTQTIADFDVAMAHAETGQTIVIDLTDTPSGGNTTVARAIMGWFVTQPRPYQLHNSPIEQRQTGIARQWVEQVLPREGRFHDGPVEVRVGRWTGSMGEGLAIGFDALGACVTGDRMAGLLGAITDRRVGDSGLMVKLPTERLSHIDGTPREDFVPHRSTTGCGPDR